ncbi:MAG: ureidoglycolate lyase [Reinekea forsetii]|nr:ureidoglycolate lyase [Reinekea forsetii]
MPNRTVQPRVLQPKPLTCEAFAAFGDVIEINDRANHFAINDGHTERYHDLASVDVTKDGGRTLINMFRSTPLAQPVALRMMERHPLSSQAFIPISNQPYWVVVAPAGEFDINQLQAFLAGPQQGVNYHAGTWHHYCLALHQVSDFMVIDRGGPGANCDLIELDGSLSLAVL